jgi:8-oxo-dGTP pyrophosphatase MutT (NUDIX family)
MTKRAEHLAHHAGQISFPGGKVEPDDDGPVSAALREAFEEVRLMPQSVSIAGGLDALRSPAGFIVQPIVGVVGGDDGLDGLVADPAEVELIFTLPLSHVINPNNFRLVPRKTNGWRNDYWVVDHDDHLIWGLSARVLNDLHRRIGMTV